MWHRRGGAVLLWDKFWRIRADCASPAQEAALVHAAAQLSLQVTQQFPAVTTHRRPHAVARRSAHHGTLAAAHAHFGKAVEHGAPLLGGAAVRLQYCLELVHGGGAGGVGHVGRSRCQQGPGLGSSLQPARRMRARGYPSSAALRLPLFPPADAPLPRRALRAPTQRRAPAHTRPPPPPPPLHAPWPRRALRAPTQRHAPARTGPPPCPQARRCCRTAQSRSGSARAGGSEAGQREISTWWRLGGGLEKCGWCCGGNGREGSSW